MFSRRPLVARFKVKYLGGFIEEIFMQVTSSPIHSPNHNVYRNFIQNAQKHNWLKLDLFADPIDLEIKGGQSFWAPYIDKKQEQSFFLNV